MVTAKPGLCGSTTGLEWPTNQLCNNFSMIDWLRIYDEQLQKVLAPTEEPLALVIASYFPGEERIGEVVNDWSFSLILGLRVSRWERAFERLLGGVALISPEGGYALEMSRSFKASVMLLLTNHRLALLANLDDKDNPPSVAWECGLDRVVSIRRAPRGLFGRGWVRITFSDTSQIRLVLGTVTWRRAKQIVEVYESIRGRNPGQS